MYIIFDLDKAGKLNFVFLFSTLWSDHSRQTKLSDEPWKWWHNWQTCPHKMEQQLILEKPDSWHWKEKVKVVTVKKWNLHSQYGAATNFGATWFLALKRESYSFEEWKWSLWKVKVTSAKKCESGYCKKVKVMTQLTNLRSTDSWQWQEKVIPLKSESNFCEKWKWLLWEREKWKWWQKWNSNFRFLT